MEGNYGTGAFGAPAANARLRYALPAPALGLPENYHNVTIDVSAVSGPDGQVRATCRRTTTRPSRPARVAAELGMMLAGLEGVVEG
jgi:hypothetical protein